MHTLPRSTTPTHQPTAEVYGQPAPWWDLYVEVIAAGAQLVDQLRALAQASYCGAPRAHVEAVRAAVWAAHRSTR